MTLRLPWYRFLPLALPVLSILVLLVGILLLVPPTGTGGSGSAGFEISAQTLPVPVGHSHDTEALECYTYHIEWITLALTVLVVGMTLQRFMYQASLFVQPRYDPPRPFPPR